MDFQKHKGGIIVTLICLAILAAVAWFCLFGWGKQTEPEGTLVEWSAGSDEVRL